MILAGLSYILHLKIFISWEICGDFGVFPLLFHHFPPGGAHLRLLVRRLGCHASGLLRREELGVVPEHRRPAVARRKNRGITMGKAVEDLLGRVILVILLGKSWENHRKPIGKWLEIMGKQWEKHRKIVGKACWEGKWGFPCMVIPTNGWFVMGQSH